MGADWPGEIHPLGGSQVWEECVQRNSCGNYGLEHT